MSSFITVITSLNQTRRQVSRALYSGGAELRFLERPADLEGFVSSPDRPALLILDADSVDAAGVDTALQLARKGATSIPVIILSLGADKGALMHLLSSYDIGNLVAKHGAVRAVFPVLDERELLVTCQKVLRRDIFGIDKYLGSWGIAVHRASLAGMTDKYRVLSEFEAYLTDLACPPAVVPDMLTVADELMINAIIHAPRNPDGTPRYEHLEPSADFVVAPEDAAEVAYACDGQRLMFAVADRFGALNRNTLQNYVTRGFSGQKVSVESKASGAGIGLTMSLRRIHQLVFNIQESVRTEVIAGWYMRVENATEFRQVSKSLNVFWLPRNPAALSAPAPARPPAPSQARPSSVTSAHAQTQKAKPGAASQLSTIQLTGRIDERTRVSVGEEGARIDLRGVTGISSTGVLHWVRMMASISDRPIELVAIPEPMVRLACEVDGVIGHAAVSTVLAPFECSACGGAQQLELAPQEVMSEVPRACAVCTKPLTFVGVSWEYEGLLESLATA